jgi:hypothetical protein
MLRSRLYLASLVSAISLAMACAATGGGSYFPEEGDGGEGGEGGAAGEGGAGATTGVNTGGSIDFVTTGAGGTTGNCGNGPNEDGDMDGFTAAEGDCNDCDPNVNPGSVEVIVTEPLGEGGAGGGDGGIPEPSDEDCDGLVDNVLPPCDDNLTLENVDPVAGAQAIDLCQLATPNDKKWGVLSAQYVRANGGPAAPALNVGILNGFGPNVNVQGGQRMLGLSSGRVRIPGQPGACGGISCTGSGVGSAPPGFPQDVPGCPGMQNINDDIGLEIKLRAPKNATGYSFFFDFYSFEFPEFVCTSYNDQFIALVSPPPPGSIDGNISFDTQNNPVSVNIAFFEVCNFDQFYPQFPCALGPGELQGTGFDTWDDAGATSWLKTTAPVTGGEEFTIRFATWDTGDSAWDSTVLIDKFRWIASGGVNVGTVVVPDPL